MENQNKFAEKIRNDYLPQECTKADEIRALDKKVRLAPAVFAYIFGSAAALILGVGMCLAMQVIGTSVLSPTALRAMGIVIGCVGIVLCLVNYYIYKAMLRSRKNKYGARILALSDELLNG